MDWIHNWIFVHFWVYRIWRIYGKIVSHTYVRKGKISMKTFFIFLIGLALGGIAAIALAILIPFILVDVFGLGYHEPLPDHPTEFYFSQ